MRRSIPTPIRDLLQQLALRALRQPRQRQRRPAPTLKSLGRRPHRTADCTLADNRKITRQMGDAFFELGGTGGAAPAISGEKGDEPLLGATAFESLDLVLDPFTRRLLRMLLV